MRCVSVAMPPSTLCLQNALMTTTMIGMNIYCNLCAVTMLTYYSNDLRVHSLAREHLQVTASRMSDWYDRKAHAQDFQPGDEVYILNLRLYQGQCPKWLRYYSDTATITKKINQVTYVIHCNAWRIKDKIVHDYKLKLKNWPVIDNDRRPGGLIRPDLCSAH